MKQPLRFSIVLLLLLLAVVAHSQPAELLNTQTTEANYEYYRFWPVSDAQEYGTILLRHSTRTSDTYLTFPEMETITSFNKDAERTPDVISRYFFDLDDGWEAMVYARASAPGRQYWGYDFVDEPGTNVLVRTGMHGEVNYLTFRRDDTWNGPSTTPLQIVTIETARDSTVTFVKQEHGVPEPTWHEEFIYSFADPYYLLDADMRFENDERLPLIILTERVDNVLSHVHFFDLETETFIWHLDEPNTSYDVIQRVNYGPNNSYYFTYDVTETTETGPSRFSVYSLDSESSTGERYSPTLLKTLELEPSYPNPFNASTRVQFTLFRDAQVKVKLFNELGQQVAELFQGQMRAGGHVVPVNASNLASGIYFCQVEVDGGLREISRLVLTK